MPTFWYAIDKCEFPFFVPFRTPLSQLSERDRARVAELCAADYHDEHMGRESRWPVVVELKSLPGGPVVSRHSVERQSAPVFLAKSLSAA